MSTSLCLFFHKAVYNFFTLSVAVEFRDYIEQRGNYIKGHLLRAIPTLLLYFWVLNLNTKVSFLIHGLMPGRQG
jgi:hypothetical protein